MGATRFLAAAARNWTNPMALHPKNDIPRSDLLRCPRDGEPMRRWTLEGIQVDRCVECAGIWLDAGELEQLLDLHRSSKADIGRLDHGMGEEPLVERDPRLCPRDGSPLRAVTDARQSHITYDACPACRGMFFDTGELADLSRFTLEERVRYLLAKNDEANGNNSTEDHLRSDDASTGDPEQTSSSSDETG
ncbi:MAG: zf-TFIIB domain-containing protein [Planctomycetota bacterium]